MPQDQSIPLQTDTLSTVPGGGVRTIGLSVPIAGAATPVQQQVVSIADASGAILDQQAEQLWRAQVIDELREIRKLIALFMGIYVPLPESSDIPFP